MSGTRAISRLLPLLVALLAASCGFHLRGAMELPPALQHTAVDGVAPYSELGEALDRAWRQSDATLLFERATGGEKTAHLQIIRDEVSRSTLAVDSAGRPTEYELHYQVTFALQDAAGKRLLRSQGVGASRTFQFNPANILAMEEEEARLKKILAEEVAQQILRRVSFQLRSQVDSPATGESGDETAR